MIYKQLPINSDNFLRFFDTKEPTIVDSKYYKGLVNAYEYKWRSFNTPLPIVAGDVLNFYTNFKFKIFDDSVHSLKVVQGGTIINDSSKFVITSEDFGMENSIITLSVPLSNTSESVFSIAIVNNSDNKILYESNCFKNLNRTEKNVNNTHLIKFRHNTNIFNYEWQFIGEEDPDYTVRVPSSILEFSYPKEDAVYKSATSGKPRKTRTVLSKAFQFETYYLTQDSHDAMNLALSLNKFSINNQEFVADSDYSVEFNQLTNIHRGSVSLLLKRYGARINKCITPPPPPEAPTMKYTMFEKDEATDLFVDINLRPIVNNIALTALFGDGETNTVTLQQGDQVEIKYNHQAGDYDTSVTSASTQIVIKENGTEVVNITTLIPDLDANFQLSSFFTAQNDIDYDVVTRIIVNSVA